ncbi:Ppx/GppA family phosphatase [Sporolactobacillus shoreae]|uniref:Ppx/GppA family phosphatase n=1 Tax=Sporolactobacillus shoreae TaxID=1465501 RepID=A0A4Z0GN87_9BACL|nr:Ppx/GppA family phosphatase [Sporolactobacillus shoreae]TGA97794.1 Ppx/GppA family phosphatase [Sporolactobacillus shoreae]
MEIVQKHAMIDIGSNSIRLVVIGIDRDYFFEELLNFKAVARLSNYIDASENLSERGIAVLLTVLDRFQSIISRERKVTIVDVVATAAMRKAKNRDQVIARVKERTGLSVRLLSGLKEAYYGYYAIINSTFIENGISIDIGGGSTEVTMFRNRELIHAHSFPFGAVTLYQTYFASGDPQAESRLESFLKRTFSQFDWLVGQGLPVIGVGGTARNLAKIDQVRQHYPMVGLHQYTIPRERLANLTHELALIGQEARENMDGLSKDRSDIIVPASAVINMLVQMNSGETFTLSNEGLREGVFFEWMLHQRGVEKIPYVLNESIRHLRHNFNLDSSHTSYVKALAFQLLNGIIPVIVSKFSDKRMAWVLSHSADLAYIGEYVNNESSSAHTFYLLTNISINGISHHNRLALALVASFKNREKMLDFAAPYAGMASKDELKMYEMLGAVLRLAHDFDRTRQHVVDEVKVKVSKKKLLQLTAYYHDDAFFEEQAAQKHKKHLERALNLPVAIRFIKH